MEATIQYNMTRALALSFGNNCVRDIQNYEEDLFEDRFHDFIEQSEKRKGGYLSDKVSGSRLSQIQADVSQCKLTRGDIALNVLLTPWFGSLTCKRTFSPMEKEAAFFWLVFYEEERMAAIRKRSFYYWTTRTEHYGAGSLIQDLRNLKNQLEICGNVMRHLGKFVDGADRRRVSRQKRRKRRNGKQRGSKNLKSHNMVRRTPRERHVQDILAEVEEEKVMRKGGKRGGGKKGRKKQFKQSRPQWNG